MCDDWNDQTYRVATAVPASANEKANETLRNSRPALEAWRALPSVESVREDDGMVALSVKESRI